MNHAELVKLIKAAQGDRTQNEYALHARVDSGTITKIINEKRVPSPATLKKLASKAHNGVTYQMLMEAAGHIERTEITATPDLIIPDELKNVRVAFHRGEFDDLTQDEVDKLAEFAKFIKTQRDD